MFSNINIYPSFPFTTIYLASSIVGINYTCLFIIFSKASATGFIENSYSKPFPDGLPKWEHITIYFGLSFNIFYNVGILASILAVFVI